jgi:arylsulfatase A-like enzyme
MTDLSRRDFLKFMSLVPMAMLVHPILRTSGSTADPSQPNIIILILDTWSADHMSMHGYPRRTMPNIEAFAQRALVYHRHYSTGTFTVPGTASILTGLHPWSHRAISLGGEIAATHRQQQIFRAVSGTRSTLGYSQNEFADLLLNQAAQNLDTHVPVSSFSLQPGLFYSSPVFRNDAQVAYASFEGDIFQRGVGFDGSLFIGPLRRLLAWRKRTALDADYQMVYPRGLPTSTELFTLEDLVDGAIGILKNLQQPSLAYLHFFPPHGPYRPKGKHNHDFADGWQAPEKSLHPLASTTASYAEQESQRLKYDQYLSSWDAELARLLDYMKTSGLLQNSIFIISSDHGELFERGEIGHNGPLIYDSVLHVPLIISRPGQEARVDVHSPTSSVDLLPTIAALAGAPAPAWGEGMLLPEFGGVPDENRSIFAMDAKMNSVHTALKQVSFSLTRDAHRLTYYQYPELDYQHFELYDLVQDPDELRDLYSARPQMLAALQQELLDKLADVNKGYPV